MLSARRGGSGEARFVGPQSRLLLRAKLVLRWVGAGLPLTATGLLLTATGLLLMATGLGCRRESEHDGGTQAADVRAKPARVPLRPAEPLRPPAESVCEILRSQIFSGESFARERLSASDRAEILGRVRAEPVYFQKTPQADPQTPRRVAAISARLSSASDPTADILAFLKASRADLALRREVFLREGYFYAESPSLALRMTQSLRLDHLFDAPGLRIERGTRSFEVFRNKGRYVQTDARGKEIDATVLLYDRISVATEPRAAPLHVDFGELKETLGFRSLTVVRASSAGLWVRFRYGGAPHASSFDVEGAVTTDGARAVLACEIIPANRQSELAQIRALERKWFETWLPLDQAIGKIVELRLPFDEPRTEFGQEDGQLRRAFREAYDRGREVYEYNGDSYYVFDSEGRVRLPEVCIDFVSDAFDWATGGQWAPRGRKRLRTRGALHLPSLPVENPRSIESLITFAEAHPDWFSLQKWDVPARIAFRERRKFFEHLLHDAELFRLGDVVFINGLRSDERYHYHSFFVSGLDPVTGMPILLAANAGPPQRRTWEGEMAGAPRRFVVARLRVLPNVLEQAYAQAKALPGVPMLLPDQGASGSSSP